MKTITFLIAATLLLAMNAQTQTLAGIDRGNLPRIPLGRNVTLHFLSPEPIRYVDKDIPLHLQEIIFPRVIQPQPKTLTLPEIEERLDQVARVKGEDGLNALRDKGKEISAELGMEKEFEKLSKLISAILNTTMQQPRILTTVLL